jgi:AcrR family transcriptional regulator
MPRPKRPSANQTRSNILIAAKEQFLAKGFDGASISRIAQSAGVNTNLIFHHFVNKKNLWVNVKGEMLRSQNTVLKSDLSSARAYFKSLLNYRFNLYDQNPDLVRLVQWQQLTEKESELIGRDSSSPSHSLNEIKHLQEVGQIKRNIPAEHILLFIVFSTHAPFMQEVIPLTQEQKEDYKMMLLEMCYSQFTVTGNDDDKK